MESIRISRDFLVAYLLAAALLASTLSHTSGDLKPVGQGAVGALLLVPALLVILLASRKPLPTILPSVLKLSLSFSSVYVIPIIVGLNFEDQSTKIAFTTVAAVGFFITMCLVRWSKQSVDLFAFAAMLFVAANFIAWLEEGFPLTFSGFFENPNTLGALNYVFLFFLGSAALRAREKLGRVFWASVILAGLSVVWVTGARSVWLALLATITTYCIWRILAQRRTYFLSWFLVLLFLLSAFVYLYVYSAGLQSLTGEGSAFTLGFGKSLFTGRERLWPFLATLISRHPLLGYGRGPLPAAFLDTDRSYHSLYFQISLQSGVFGLVLFLLLMGRIWSFYWVGRDDPIVRLSGAFLTGILVHQTFEVSLTQNELPIGLVQWLILGMGVSQILKRQLAEDQTSALKPLRNFRSDSSQAAGGAWRA